MDRHEIPGPGGRTLDVVAAGEEGAPALVFHHGSPGSGLLHSTEIESAERLGARLIAYSRPGFGGSSPAEGRVVADAAEDVAAILDALGVERFATYGWSGGGPHALACGALLGDRCAAAASLAGVAPHDAEGLAWKDGMGEDNVEEFGAAEKGEEAARAFLAPQAAALAGASPRELVDGMRTLLSDVDVAAIGDDLGAWLADGF